MKSEILKIVLGLLSIFSIAMVINIGLQSTRTKYKTETALASSGNDSDLVKGVFIRDEQVLRYNGDGIVSYEVADGGKVGIGSVIANVYSSESQISIKQEIEACDQKLSLLRRITNPGTTQSAQPSSISNLFSETYKSYLYCRERGDLSEMNSQRDEMLVLLSTYQLVTGTPNDYAGKTASLTSKLESLSYMKENPVGVICADRAAYFVSYADGYEGVFSMKSASALVPSDLQKISDNVDTDPQIIGKLISGYEWYLAAVVDNTTKKYKVGDFVTLKFASTSVTAKGEVISINSKDGEEQSLLLISCQTLNYDMVQHRTENVEIIRGSYYGIQVPRSALRFLKMEEEVEDPETGEIRTEVVDCRGVFVLDGEQPAFRKVDVVYEGTDFVISRFHAGTTYLQLYDSIITKGIDANGE